MLNHTSVLFPTRDLKRNWVIVPNDWKCKIKNKTSQKLFFKIFCFNNSGTRNIKDLQKHSNKEIYVTLQSDNTTHKPFQFISWSNFIEWFQNLSPGVGGKVLTDLFIKCSDGYILLFALFFFLLNPAIHRRQFTKYLMSQTVKNKMSLIYILYSITSYF